MRHNDWKNLFVSSMNIIDETIKKHDFTYLRELISFGGGTALMIQINHRESYDIDLFIDDPQFLNYFNPFSQDYNLTFKPDNYVPNGSKSLKINFESGEIDFICAGCLTKNPFFEKEIGKYKVKMETPCEIIVKKIVYRGDQMPSRDIFDISAVIKKYGKEYLIDELLNYRDECEKALKSINKKPKISHDNIINGLIIKPEYASLKNDSLKITRSLLEEVINYKKPVPNIKHKILNFLNRVVRGRAP